MRPSFHVFTTAFIVFSSKQITSASTIVVNADKTISIEGEKMFPVGAYSICHTSFGEPVSCHPENATAFDFGAYASWVPPVSWISAFESAQVYFPYKTSDQNNNLLPLPFSGKDSPYFFGYYQVDEPSASMHTTVRSHFNAVRADDPNHPIILNLAYPEDPYDWQDSADILSYDRYSINDGAGYPRRDSILDWDLRAKTLGPFASHSTSDFSKPFFMVIQSTGRASTCCSVPTPQEVRSQTYAAISMGVQGLVYYGYIVAGPSGNTGLSMNSALYSYVKQLVQEIHGLNSILVMETQASSFHAKQDWSSVAFAPNPTTSVEGITVHDFSYILKRDMPDNRWYLIVVNKASVTHRDVRVTVSSLAGAGTQTVTTLGLETAGSQRAGRKVPIQNGVFTDSFDGYAAHIYEIPTSNTDEYADEGAPSEDGGVADEDLGPTESGRPEKSVAGGCTCAAGGTATVVDGAPCVGLAFTLLWLARRRVKRDSRVLPKGNHLRRHFRGIGTLRRRWQFEKAGALADQKSESSSAYSG